MVEKKERLFGAVALEARYITPEQLSQCLEEQKRLRRRGVNMLIGQLLIKYGYIDHIQFMEILKLQQKFTLQCPTCSAKHDIYTKVEGKSVRCNNCGKLIMIPPSLTESTSDEIAVKSLESFGIVVPLEGRREFAKYQLIKKLGQGGMGIIFLARDRTTGNTVALKITKQLKTSKKTSKRFIREAEIVKSLNHPNIVKVYEIGVHNSIQYFTMQYIDGVSLDYLFSQKKHSIMDLIAILEKVARAIAYSHQQGIIHRDIKPSNIMVDRNNNPYIMDFGLAKLIETDSKFGVIVGTPFYMSPEQVRAEIELDERSDIYSLGVILYEMLAGIVPFTGKTEAEVYEKILGQKPIPPSVIDKSVDPDLEAIALMAIEKNREQRYRTATQFADEMKRFLQTEPVDARPQELIPRFIQEANSSPIPLILIGAAIVFMILFILIFKPF